ncbi:MAG: DUF554 domain-containing protein [Bacillota bacterium]|nr:DUF554 domain-containing protein [Bacillota bacterium]
MTGTIINAATIILGGILGKIIGNKLPDSMQKTVLNGIGLIVILLGIEMALGTSNILVILISLVVGIIIGEYMKIEYYLEVLGGKIEKAVQKKFSGTGDVAKGFVTATLLFGIGPMAIMGSLENGLLGTYKLLGIKSTLDGITSVVLGASLGIGVIFSAGPVLIYQGLISVFASWLEIILKENIIVEMTALGGVLIISIGLNILGLTKIKVGNMLPGLLVVIILAMIFIK